MQDWQEGILQRQFDISQDLVSEVSQNMLFFGSRRSWATTNYWSICLTNIILKFHVTYKSTSVIMGISEVL